MAKMQIADGIISSSADYSLYRGLSKIATVQDGEFRVLGDLIAENYIVSSSVTNIEYQSLSGSTIFGDSADDIHQMTGSYRLSKDTTGSGGERTTNHEMIIIKNNNSVNPYSGFGASINFQGRTYNNANIRNLSTIRHQINDLSNVNSETNTHWGSSLSFITTNLGNSTTVSTKMEIQGSGNIVFPYANQKISGSASSTGSFGSLSVGLSKPANGVDLQVQDKFRLSNSNGAYMDVLNNGANIIFDHWPGNFQFKQGDVEFITANQKISGSSTSTGSFGSVVGTINNANQVSLTALDIDGGTDIGAAIVDADLMILDDGADGTNRKATMSRLKTYMSGLSGGSTLGNVQVGITTANTIDVTGDTLHIGDNTVLTGSLTISKTILTATGSATSYNVKGASTAAISSAQMAVSASYIIYKDVELKSVVQNGNADYQLMKSFTASKNGNLNVKFTARITSGTYYWAFRIAKNSNSSVYKTYDSHNIDITNIPFSNYLDTSNTSAVHNPRLFNINIEDVIAGDIVEVYMTSAAANGTPATGNGQSLDMSDFKISSDSPSAEIDPEHSFGKRIGVGTTSPGVALEVIGSISGSATSTGSFGKVDALEYGEINMGIGGQVRDLRMAAGSKLIFDINTTGHDTDRSYIDFGRTSIDFYTSNVKKFMIFTGNGIGIPTTHGLYLDSGYNTFIAESSADNIRFTAGAVPILDLTTTSISGSSISTGSFGAVSIDGSPNIHGLSNAVQGGSGGAFGFNTAVPDGAGITIVPGNDGKSSTALTNNFGLGITHPGTSGAYSSLQINTGVGKVLWVGNDGNIEMPAPNAKISGSATSTGSFGKVVGEGSELTNLQRPITTHIANFTASMAYAGNYNIVHGNLTCSIKVHATSSVATGTEYEFFQTSSVGNMLFEIDPGVTVFSKNDNLNIAGQSSGASLKKVDTDIWHLVGDLT